MSNAVYSFGMTIEIWLRRRDLGERHSHYDAFCHYRDMPPGARSIDGAYRLHRTSCRKLPPRDGVDAPGIWRVWAKRFAWADRAEAQDAAIENAARRDRIAAIERMNEQHAAIASALLEKVVERITAFDAKELSPGHMAVWLEKAAALERRARGVPTDYVRQEHAGNVGVGFDLTELFSDMTEEERLVLRRILERRAGKRPTHDHSKDRGRVPTAAEAATDQVH